MSLANIPTYSGGCQCGAVRFHVEGAMRDPSICHCRMCQKATGGFYAPLVSVGVAKFSWTRGEPKRFSSSSHVQRGFCADCGTPLTYEAPDGIALSIGAFDHPEELAPAVQWGIEAKLPYVDGLPKVRAAATMDDISAAPWLAEMVSRQHPDHDTETWPPEEQA